MGVNLESSGVSRTISLVWQLIWARNHLQDVECYYWSAKFKKTILQDLCKNSYSWDHIVPSNSTEDWESWKGQLHLLENVVMKKGFKPPGFGKIACSSLRHFSDSSQDEYGQVSYIWLLDENGSIHCCLAMRKSKNQVLDLPRVSPYQDLS